MTSVVVWSWNLEVCYSAELFVEVFFTCDLTTVFCVFLILRSSHHAATISQIVVIYIYFLYNIRETISCTEEGNILNLFF